MKTSTFRPAHLICITLLLSIMGLTGCDDDDNDGALSAPATLSGQAVKGPVANGTVTAYAVTAGAKGAVLATTTTNATGDYTLPIENYTGAVLVEVTGGSYVDEATGSTVALTGALQAVVSDVTAGSDLSVQLTPLTTLAAARALNMTGGLTTANIDAANQQVGEYFGGIDLLATKPVDPSASGSATGASQAAIDYGLILGGLSTQAQTLGLPNALELIAALASDIADGVFDGQSGDTPINLNEAPMDPATGSSSLGAAISAYSGDADNVSGGTVSPGLVTSLQNPEPPAAPSGVTATPGTGQATVSWSAVSGAGSYVIYMSTDSGVSKSNFATRRNGASSPEVFDGLTNGTPYYFVVTAVSLEGEGAASAAASATPSAVSYTIGGTVSGLTGTGLVLRNNGGDDQSVSANGSFVFPTAVGSGGTYNVTVATQPGGQVCTVGNGNGTVGSANVTTVTVTCVASGGGGAGTATVNITNATPSSGNGLMVVSAVTVEADTLNGDPITRVSVTGTINALPAELKLYYTTATTDVFNMSFNWDSFANSVFKDPASGEVLIDKPNGQINLDVVGLTDADGVFVVTPTQTADISATINVTPPLP